MAKKTARIISILGHPFLTIPVYTLIITFRVFEFKKAFFVSFFIVGCFFIPLGLWNYFKTKNGTYTNFDVSVREQRSSMYLFALPILAVVLLAFYLTNQSQALILSVLFSFILLVLSYFVNFFIKCSGHVSMTIFLSCLILPVNYKASFILLFCTSLIGWSRMVLKRHTFVEIIAGLFLGLATGLTMLYYQNYFHLK